MQAALLPATEVATITALVAADGSAAHPWVRHLVGSGSQRDLADAAHVLCSMHGTHPDLVETALSRCEDGSIHDWLAEAVHGFAGERATLAGIVSAVGPLPSTPGHAQAEAAIVTQRHALDILSRSDRTGCAIGAVAALVIDWHGIRPVLAAIAHRLGTTLAATALPRDEPPAGTTPGVERARLFGAQQFLAQQRGLWSLLESRSAARGHG